MRVLKIFVSLLFLFITLTCFNCSVDDKSFVNDYRPIVVQYNDEISKMNDYLKDQVNVYLTVDKFAIFADNMEELRQKAIVVNPPKSQKMKEFYNKFNLLIEKGKKIGLAFSIDYITIIDTPGFYSYNKLNNDDKKWLKSESDKWLNENEMLYRDFLLLNEEVSKIAKEKFSVSFQMVSFNAIYNEQIKIITSNIK